MLFVYHEYYKTTRDNISLFHLIYVEMLFGFIVLNSVACPSAEYKQTCPLHCRD